MQTLVGENLVVIIDQDVEALKSMEAVLKGVVGVVGLTDPSEVIDLAETQKVALVIADEHLPGMEGFELLARVKSCSPLTRRFLLSGEPDRSRGGQDPAGNVPHRIIGKPWESERLFREVISGVHAFCSAMSIKMSAMQPLDPSYLYTSSSPVMMEAYDRAYRLARLQEAVLIHGEPGTGKKVMARLIHTLRQGGGAPFMVLDCRSFADKSLCSIKEEGHGNRRERVDARELLEAAVVRASSGTLVLAAVDQSPSELQLALVQMMEGIPLSFNQGSGKKPRPPRTNVIATSTRDPASLVADICFRADLYHLLTGVTVSIPALRHRPEDIPLLAAHFTGCFGVRWDRPSLRLNQQALDMLRCLPFPGNVRQLRSLITASAVAASTEVVGTEELLATLQQGLPRGPSTEKGHMTMAKSGDHPSNGSFQEKSRKEIDLKIHVPILAEMWDRRTWLSARQQALDEVDRIFIKEWNHHFEGDLTCMTRKLGLSLGYITSIANRASKSPN